MGAMEAADTADISTIFDFARSEPPWPLVQWTSLTADYPLEVPVVTENKYRYFSEQLAALGDEISKLLIALDIDIELPDVAEKVLNNDDSICGRKNQAAFDKLRKHFMALYPLEERSIERIGAQETSEILEEIREHLRKLRGMGRPEN